MSPLPVNLISGLLGSGKTTTLKHLIQHKPSNERWGIIINEFGDIGIDAASLSPATDLVITEVSGGCICCTAQFGLNQAIQTLLQNTTLDRLLIEPTGLGHPAKIYDTLNNVHLARPLALQSNLCVMNPQHLTAERWQKSGVMRDLASLSDIIVLNKTDLCSPEDLQQAHQILDACYPAKTQRVETQNGIVNPALLQQAHQAHFVFLSGLAEHHQQTAACAMPFESQLPGLLKSEQQTGEQTYAIGWIFSPQVQFNRVILQQCFKTWAPYLRRAKGILKTGREWQLIQWSDNQLTFSDVAWRQDSRLELIFDMHLSPPHASDVEQQLQEALRFPA